MSRQQSITEFLGFSTEDWASWLKKFVGGEACRPEWPVWEDNYVEQMLVIRRKLKTRDPARTAMLDGLSLALETTPRDAEDAAVLYYLLHAAALLVPLKARNHLRVLLRTRALAELEYAESRLETLLLSVLSKYSIDDDLVSFIDGSVQRSEDLPFVLTSFRILASRNLADSWSVASHLLSRELDPESQELFADELKIVADEQHWPTLYRWYCESLTVLDPALSGKLLNIITAHLIPFFEDDEETTLEPAFHLMKAHVAVARREFTSQHLAVLARFISTKRGLEQQRCIEGVRAIYMFGQKLGREALWYYMDHDEEPFSRTGIARGIVGVVSREDPLDDRGLRIPTYLKKEDPGDVEVIDILVKATPDETSYREPPVTGSDDARVRIN